MPLPRPKNHSFIYAHRGATKNAADNTRLAFNHALQQKTDGIETDVQLTKDQVAILYHNQWLTEQGYPNHHICDFTFAQLKKLNFACTSPSACTEPPITLEEFINRYKGQCKLHIEIKHRDWEDSLSAQLKIQHCLDLLGKTQNNDIIISSFNLECLEYAHQSGTQIPLFYAFRKHQGFLDIKNSLDRSHFINGVCCPIQTLSPTLMQWLHSSHKWVATYTCNTTHDIQKALALKVDILLTDELTLAFKIRAT
jgi:glycerophosphoryl diester phosphodiesterase